MKRQFGRDPGADNYGRHALRHPGGDLHQRDVLKLINSVRTLSHGIHPTRVREDYVGTHRVSWWDSDITTPLMASDGFRVSR